MMVFQIEGIPVTWHDIQMAIIIRYAAYWILEYWRSNVDEMEEDVEGNDYQELYYEAYENSEGVGLICVKRPGIISITSEN